MARIAQQGPSFSDVVLPHAERNLEEGEQSAHSYNYVPATVLGDWDYEVEPQWTGISQVNKHTHDHMNHLHDNGHVRE